MQERTIPCLWCPKRFPDLSARYQHVRASHTGRDLSLVAFDVVRGEQVARHNDLQAIGDVVKKITARVGGNG